MIAGQAELSRGERTAATAKLLEAQQRLDRARKFNPDSPRLSVSESELNWI